MQAHTSEHTWPLRARLSDSTPPLPVSPRTSSLGEAEIVHQPVVMFVGGQAGADMTAVTQMASDRLGRAGDFVLVSMDGEGEDAVRRRAGRVSRDSGEPALRERAHQYAIEHRHHVLVVTDMASDAEFKELARRTRWRVPR